MLILNSVLSWFIKKRIHQMELFIKHPHEVQNDVLKTLLASGRYSAFGEKYAFKDLYHYEDFKKRVPIHTYEQLYPYIERVLRGEQKVLWPSKVEWFAKSSGTTNANSKFIPVTSESLRECHFKAGKDLYSIYASNHPNTKIFSGKGLGIGGSYKVNEKDPTGKSKYGDVSAVIMQQLPFWAEFIRTPSLEIALLENWEEKMEKLARVTAKENVVQIAGVPTWTVLLLQRIVELEKKKTILDVWPNLEVFFHGGVAFNPYRNLFKSLIPSEKMNYWEIYNASEGFFGIQDQPNKGDLLLMLDYGIYYEFISPEEQGKEFPHVVSLQEVELNKNYAMVITTNTGLWRYNIGDTIKFTSKSPYRIKVTGRTKHFINAFGEEVIIENVEMAIAQACEQTDTEIDDFTVAPIYLEKSKRGGHEWVIEFKKQPADLNKFIYILDDVLRKVNSDYDAKRAYDIALVLPIVHCVETGTFYTWMKNRGKLGGQNKVPRLSNSREYVEEILALRAQR